MSAPHTSQTIHLPISAMDGLQSERLYTNIKTTAMSSILANEQMVFSIGTEGLSALSILVDSLSYAIAIEVTREIQNHSNLLAAPGALTNPPSPGGIIKGYVA